MSFHPAILLNFPYYSIILYQNRMITYKLLLMGKIVVRRIIVDILPLRATVILGMENYSMDAPKTFGLQPEPNKKISHI